LLGHPRSTRCTARRWTSTTNSTYSRVSPMVSTVKKSVAAGRWPGRVGLRPARPAPPRCGSDPVATQDPSYRGRRHPHAQVAALPNDPQVTPARVLPRQPDHEGDDLLIQITPFTTSARVGPPAGDQLPVPPQERRGRDQECRPPLPRQQLRQCGQQHPIGRGVPRTRYLTAQYRQLMAKHRDLHDVRVRRWTAAEHPQNPPNDHQRHAASDHTTEPAEQRFRRPAPQPDVAPHTLPDRRDDRLCQRCRMNKIRPGSFRCWRSVRGCAGTVALRRWHDRGRLER